MRRRHLQWFEAMRRAHGFQPGVIRLGSKHENPSYLSRYQDGHYPYGTSQPIGWPVRVENGGRYRITLRWDPHQGGALAIRWKEKVSRLPLEPGRYTGELELSPGAGMLEVWFEDERGRRLVRKTNRSTDGDAVVELLEG